MRPLKKTPDSFTLNGRVREYGLFKTPFRNLNIDETQIFHPPIKAPRLLRRWRLKEWQHIAVFHPEYALGLAIVDTHYLGNSFCYFVDRRQGRHCEHSRQFPGGRNLKVARELWDDDCFCQARNYTIHIENRLVDGRHRIVVEIKETRKLPAIAAEFELLENLEETQPLIVALPINHPNRPLYTHKAVCRVRGEMTLDGERIAFDEKRDLAMLDVQKTFYPYNTHWNWATCAGYDRDGRLLALNLVQNMIRDDEQHNENCLWVDGALTPWSAARFNFHSSALLQPWQIETTDGKCRLTFTPQGERKEKINLGLIVSDFHQPFGIFSGAVTDADGRTYELNDFYGVCEHHLARF